MIRTDYITGFESVFTSSHLYCIKHDNAVFTVVFNSPENLNALSPEMARNARELSALLESYKPRAVIFRGEGKAFSAGGNLEYLLFLTEKDQETVAKEMREFYASYLNLVNQKCPSIAFINGHAVGAGFCLALACDLRYVTSSAKLGMNFVKIGLNPGMAAEYYALRKLPSAIAIEMLTTGKLFTAHNLDKYHLFNFIGVTENAEQFAYEAAVQIACNRALSVSISLEIARDSRLSLHEVLDKQANGQGICLTSGEVKEAVSAQIKKQPFIFKS